MFKYSHGKACWRCKGWLEYIYTVDNVDEYYCPSCNLSIKSTLETASGAVRLSETYGE